MDNKQYLIIHYLMDGGEIVLFELPSDTDEANRVSRERWNAEIQEGKAAGDDIDDVQTWWDDAMLCGQVAYADGTKTTYDIVDSCGQL